MQKNSHTAIEDVKSRLIELGGRTTQDLGLGRVTGQVLGYVFLSETECSLDDIGRDLGLSKAAVSTAARQLESLGLMQRVWKKGDRKHYYETARNVGPALRHAILEMIRGKLRTMGAELDGAEEVLNGLGRAEVDAEGRYLKKRVQRARKLRKRAMQILDSPLLKLLGG